NPANRSFHSDAGALHDPQSLAGVDETLPIPHAVSFRSRSDSFRVVPASRRRAQGLASTLVVGGRFDGGGDARPRASPTRVSALAASAGSRRARRWTFSVQSSHATERHGKSGPRGA